MRSWEVIDAWGPSPVELELPPPTEAEVAAAESKLGLSFSADYRDFLLRFGGGNLGSETIAGFPQSEKYARRLSASVVAINEHFRRDNWPGINDWVIFCSDGSGNPVGFDRDGVVWASYHDGEGIVRLADSFAAWVDAMLTECMNDED